MSARQLLPSAARILRTTAAPSTIVRQTRGFGSTRRLLQETVAEATPKTTTAPAAAPVKKPVGAFRGGLFGFLLGAVTSSAAMYYYVLEEYRVSNELLTEDIYALQSAVQRIESYVRVLEDRVEGMQKKK